jgi:hypothetical protein
VLNKGTSDTGKVSVFRQPVADPKPFNDMTSRFLPRHIAIGNLS